MVLPTELGRGVSLGEDDLSFGSFESEVTSEKPSRVVQSAARVGGEVKTEDTDLLFFFLHFQEFPYYYPHTLFCFGFLSNMATRFFQNCLAPTQSQHTFLALPTQLCLHLKLGKTCPPGKMLLIICQTVSPWWLQPAFMLWKCGSLWMVCLNTAICIQGT